MLIAGGAGAGAPLRACSLSSPVLTVCNMTRQADWGSGYWQQDMEQRCYTGSHLTAIWAIGIPGVVLLCIGEPVLMGPRPNCM